MSTNSLYVFGDSFAWGNGTWPGEPYYEEFPELVSKRYDEILAEEFDLSIRNFGIPGAGDEFTFIRFLHNLPQITKDDIVLINLSLPFRFPILKKVDEGYELAPCSVDRLDDYGIEKDHANIYIDYYYTVKSNENSIKLDKWKYILAYRNILEKVGCTAVVWDVENTPYFDQISKEDKHYSWQGHRELATWLSSKVVLNSISVPELEFNLLEESLSKDTYNRNV